MIDVIEDFAARQPGQGKLVVTRASTTAPAYDPHGYPIDPSPVTTLRIVGQVCVVDGRGLRVLADQGITGESRMILTATPLTTRDKTREPDRVTGCDLDNETWVVINTQTFFTPDSEVFYKVVVARDTLL